MIPGTGPITTSTVTGLIAVIRQSAGKEIGHCPQTVTVSAQSRAFYVAQRMTNHKVDQIHNQEHCQDQKDPKYPDHLFLPPLPASV